MEYSGPWEDVNHSLAVGLSELVGNPEVSQHEKLVNPVGDEQTQEGHQVQNGKASAVSHSHEDHAQELSKPELEDELRTRVHIFIFFLSDLPGLSHVASASSVPASDDGGPNLVHNQSKMWCEDLEEDGSHNGDTDYEVPSQVELCELALENIRWILHSSKVVISEQKHDGVVDVLEDTNRQGTINVIISDVLGVSHLSSN
jgi:hypothetical protein